MVISIIAKKIAYDTNQYKVWKPGKNSDQMKLNRKMNKAPIKIPIAISPRTDKFFLDNNPIRDNNPKTKHVIPKEIAMTSNGTNIVKAEINTPITIA